MITHSYYLRDPRVRREAETLAEAGHQVDVLSLRRPGEPASETVSGVRIYRIPLGHKRAGKVRYVLEYALGLAFFTIAMSGFALRRRYDLVQVHTPPDVFVFAALVPKLLGARILLDLHDPMPEAMMTKFGAGDEHWLVRVVAWQERISVAFADFVITVTEQVRSAVVSRGHPAGRIDVVMNVADDRLFQHRTNTAPAPTLTMVFMGTLSRQYGVDLAIDALATVRQTVPEARLRVIGDGEERPALEAQARELGLQDVVEFVGQVPIDRIPHVALPASMGLAPHRRDRLYDMCFPSKIYDYLKLGLPVAAARTKSLDYYYGDGIIAMFESGSSQGLAQTVLALHQDPERVAAMRARAEAFLATRNWPTERERFLAVVDRLIGAPLAGPLGAPPTA